MLEHGGRLIKASLEEGIPLSDWLDLSTGISPLAYPTPAVPEEVWRRLPEDEDGLLQAASTYYQTSEDRLLAVPGSQAAIQTIPTLFEPQSVGFITPSYNEHWHAWTKAGHHCVSFDSKDQILESADRLDCVVLCNPNNPTGLRWTKQELIELAQVLAGKSGTLLVDEAFVDATPTESIADKAGSSNIIVLRSIGKFFGLAGARVGFAIAGTDTIFQLKNRLGPWTITGPSRYVVQQALKDSEWQLAQIEQLESLSSRLTQTIEKNGLSVANQTPYFVWATDKSAGAIHANLRRSGILTRYFEEQNGIRFGLPRTSADFVRLDQALANACIPQK